MQCVSQERHGPARSNHERLDARRRQQDGERYGHGPDAGAASFEGLVQGVLGVVGVGPEEAASDVPESSVGMMVIMPSMIRVAPVRGVVVSRHRVSLVVQSTRCTMRMIRNDIPRLPQSPLGLAAHLLNCSDAPRIDLRRTTVESSTRRTPS